MKAIIDADILLWEVGYAAEIGHSAFAKDPLSLPNFDYVEELLHKRIEQIAYSTKADEVELFLTVPDVPTIRYEIAKTKPYKGGRKQERPWHYRNLLAYMEASYPVTFATHNLEADDMMAIAQTKDPDNTIVCSRDKDLLQVPGWHYSWELGRQAEFGPEYVENPGYLNLSDKNKLSGTGYVFFAAQMLMGDPADSVPGLPKWGATKTYKWLEDCKDLDHYRCRVHDAYASLNIDFYTYMIEQAQLLWLVRRFNVDGTPELWREDLYE